MGARDCVLEEDETDEEVKGLSDVVAEEDAEDWEAEEAGRALLEDCITDALVGTVRLVAGVVLSWVVVVVPLALTARTGKAAGARPRRFAWGARSAGARRMTACILEELKDSVWYKERETTTRAASGRQVVKHKNLPPCQRTNVPPHRKATFTTVQTNE